MVAIRALFIMVCVLWRSASGDGHGLLEHQPRAIKNACKLLSIYEPHNPEKDNPCTTVHLLVEELNVIKRAMETPSSTQQ